MRNWQGGGAYRGDLPPATRKDSPVIYCPRCYEEVIFCFSDIPGALADLRQYAECEQHGIVTPVDQFGQKH
jgi:hypothetical protein